MARFDCQFGLTDIEEMSKTHLCVTVRVRPALSGSSKPVGFESEAEGEGRLAAQTGPKLHQVRLLQLPSPVGFQLQFLLPFNTRPNGSPGPSQAFIPGPV